MAVTRRTPCHPKTASATAPLGGHPSRRSQLRQEPRTEASNTRLQTLQEPLRGPNFTLVVAYRAIPTIAAIVPTIDSALFPQSSQLFPHSGEAHSHNRRDCSHTRW